jgi:hypothetical protein
MTAPPARLRSEATEHLASGKLSSDEAVTVLKRIMARTDGLVVVGASASQALPIPR